MLLWALLVALSFFAAAQVDPGLDALPLSATLATFWLLHRAIERLPPATVIAYSYLSGLFALLLQALGFGRTASPLAGSGAGLILVGMAWLIRRSGRTSPTG